MSTFRRGRRLAPVVPVLLAGLLLAAGLFVAAPADAAPAAPTGVRLTPGVRTLAVTWDLPVPDTLSAVVVTRTGPAFDNSVTDTRTIAPPTGGVTLTGLVAGAGYTVTVAFVDAAGTGPATTRRTRLSTTGLPRVVGQTLTATPAAPTTWDSYDDGPCALYHWEQAVCGRIALTFRTTGYTAATARGWWTASAAVTRTFGCLDGAGRFVARVTSVHRYDGDGYPYFADEPVVLEADGTSVNPLVHTFANPLGYGGDDEMPHFVCPAGSAVSQSAVQVSDVVAVLHHGDEAFAGDPTAPVEVLHLPDVAAT